MRCLQGGYFDAGDHNKFQLPTAYTTARLNWLVHMFKGGLEKTYFDVRRPAAPLLTVSLRLVTGAVACACTGAPVTAHTRDPS